MGVAIDVTAQVKGDLELRQQREEMTRLSRVALMGELTASLAHELNQPLTAIASNAAAGKRFLARGSLDPQMFEELLDDVYNDARRAGDGLDRRSGVAHVTDPTAPTGTVAVGSLPVMIGSEPLWRRRPFSPVAKRRSATIARASTGTILLICISWNSIWQTMPG
jgi:signal transduction histidine kinase